MLLLKFVSGAQSHDLDLMIPVLVILNNCIDEQYALFATNVQNSPYQMKMFLTRGQLLGASEEGVTIR